MNLNKQQSKIVLSEGNISVLATAGAGKTRVLIAKVLHLLNQGISLITLVTFTKASAVEIEERLIKHLGGLPKGLVVGTFHSIISKHISRHSKIGLMSSDEQVSLLHQHYTRHFSAHDGYDDFFAYFEKKINGSLSETIEEYDTVLNAYYDNMSVKTAGLIDLISMGQTMIQERQIPLLPTEWLLVDEYQDTDLEQLKFVLIHGLSCVKLLLVGDPNQAIYGFRNALGEKAFTLMQENIDIQNIPLNTNYR